jgi:hypothetical protein
VALAAVAVAVLAVRSALRTIVVPRGIPDRFTRVVFRILDAPTAWQAGRASSAGQVDRRTAGLAIRLLLALLVSWLAAIGLAGAGIQWALGSGSAGRAFSASASALTTLGLSSARGGASAAAYIEAVLGVGLVALIIGYLPSLYAAFPRREALVTKLATRTGLPPAGPVILRRLWCPAGPQTVLNETWQAREDWFVDLSESHTSFPVLAFFHSPQTAKSWITAAGAILDAAALALAAVDADWGPETGMCLHAGIVSLRHIADFHGIPYDGGDAAATIAVTEHEVIAACQELKAAGGYRGQRPRRRLRPVPRESRRLRPPAADLLRIRLRSPGSVVLRQGSRGSPPAAGHPCRAGKPRQGPSPACAATRRQAAIRRLIRGLGASRSWSGARAWWSVTSGMRSY